MLTSCRRCKCGGWKVSTVRLAPIDYRNSRSDASHLDSSCGKSVSTRARKEWEVPTCVWNQDTAIRSSFPVTVNRRQCRININVCWIPCWVYKWRKLAPPNCSGPYRISRLVWRLKPHLGTMIGIALCWTLSSCFCVKKEHPSGKPIAGIWFILHRTYPTNTIYYLLSTIPLKASNNVLQYEVWNKYRKPRKSSKTTFQVFDGEVVLIKITQNLLRQSLGTTTMFKSYTVYAPSSARIMCSVQCVRHTSEPESLLISVSNSI